MKLLCWNVNGLRSIVKKGALDTLNEINADIVCLQEIKMHQDQIEKELINPLDYYGHFSCAKQRGYSGLASYFKPTYRPIEHYCALGDERFDAEGRFLISKHNDFTLYNTYFPSGTTGDLRQDFKYKFLDYFYAHLCAIPLKERGRIIICGDFNICHKDIDIHHPREAEKRLLSGFLPEERRWMDKFCELQFYDAFREIYPDQKGKYTWWTYRANARAKNLGWRIDYCFVGSALKDKIRSASILSEIGGSDHCPIVLELENLSN